jgi:hypothetical protein
MDKEISGEKITQILEETRVVIPGTEIFLAFQLGAIFTEVFSRIAYPFLIVHLTHSRPPPLPAGSRVGR